MITLIIFLVLTIVEFAIVYFKWNDVKDIHGIAKVASNVVGVEKEYDYYVNMAIGALKKMKSVLWIAVIGILFLNFIIAFFVSILYSFIAFIVHLLIQLL